MAVFAFAGGFVNTLSNIIDKINNVLWGDAFILLIFGACVYLSVKCGFVQLKLGSLFGAVFGRHENEKGKMSRFAAISTALAASMGTGNIIGTAAALAMGGAGAVLWMCVSAFFGMAAAYAENYIGAVYGERDGFRPPVTYIRDIPCGKYLSAVYAAVCVGAAFSMGNMIQGNAFCKSVQLMCGADIHIIAAVFAVLAGCIILGGAERISSAAEKMIPFASVMYILLAVWALIIYRERLPRVFSEIFSSAFGLRAAAGGVMGYGVKRAVSIGIRRGVFSNEAGLGSSVSVHSACGCTDPDRAGKWAACEVFIDTVICCTLTALVVLAGGGDISVSGEAAALEQAFSCIPLGIGEIMLPLLTAVFAAASMLGWCCCGELCLSNLTKRKSAGRIYRGLHIILLYIGGAADMSVLWGTADIFNWLMLAVNLSAVIILSGKIEKNN